jgi:light-regulated signal transduction histidine kinase (bacteriophytochrome)
MHGLDPTSDTPSQGLWYDRVHVGDKAEAQRELQSAIDGGASEYNGRYRVLTPDGDTRWIETFGRIERDPQGGLRRVVGIAIDATERHRVVETLTKLNADLERANDSLKKFSSIAAHDLQEPLRKIEQFGDLISKECSGQINSDGEFYLSIMKDAARRMRALINGLLAFSRAGNRALSMAEINMDKLMQRVLLNCSSAIEETRAQVRVDDFPPLFGDESLVEHLFQNLISNALKYAKPGVAPRIEVTARADDEAMILSVVDDGVGIAPEHHDIIFEPFTRLNPREKVKGAGIGLAFCRTVCERHDWRLTVASALGAGATFSVTAPKKESRHDV